ncbi:MAG: energy transducer TonB [bacterium]|nr:energy transducer TonB [bacterium]
MVQPKYPDIARDMGIEGDVVLLVYIDETGTVRNALVQSSPELPAMEEEAVKAAYKCKFAPAKQQDRPVGVWYTIFMEFKR